MVWIRKLVATQVKTSFLENATLSIKADNLSSHPTLLDSDPKIRIDSSDESLVAWLVLGAAAGRADNHIELLMSGISVDEMASKIKSDGSPPISGGTMTLNIAGKLRSIDSDLKISPSFSGSSLSIGSTTLPADNLSIPLFLRGPIDNPRVKIDSKALTNAVAEAGKKELLNRAAEKLGIDSSATQDSDKLEDAAKKLLGGFLNKKKDEE